jgi:hypothetical protein
MSGKGFYTAQDGHLVNILPPIDITGGKTSQAFTLGRHAHVTILVLIGVSAAAFTKILLESCDDASGTNPVAQPFDIFKQETAGASHDVLGARTAVTSAGYTPSANDNIFYVIEFDASQLPVGKSYLQLHLTNGTNSVIAAAVAILSGARFGGDQSDTVTA